MVQTGVSKRHSRSKLLSTVHHFLLNTSFPVPRLSSSALHPLAFLFPVASINPSHIPQNRQTEKKERKEKRNKEGTNTKKKPTLGNYSYYSHHIASRYEELKDFLGATETSAMISRTV